MTPQEMAEEIAFWLLEEDFLTDQQMMERFQVDEFELIKAKNILCRYHGIAFERPQNLGELTMPVLMLSREFKDEGGREMLHRVFHDPDFKTKKRAKEIERKQSLKGEVKEIFQALQDEWGKLFHRPENGRDGE
jgi:hypothetical protein